MPNKRSFAEILYNITNYFSYFTKLLIFATALFLICLIYHDTNKFNYEYSLLKPWNYDDLIAPFDFGILKEKEDLAREKNYLLNQVSPVFFMKKDIRINKINDFVKKANIKLKELYPNISDDKINSIKTDFKIFYDTVYQKGIIQSNPLIDNKGKDYKLSYIDGNTITTRTLGDFYTIQDVITVLRKIVAIKYPDYTNISKFLIEYIEQNVLYDEKKSEELKEEVLRNISTTYGIVQNGEKIISKGEIINNEKYKILNSLKYEYLNKSSDDILDYRNSFTGRLVLIGFILLLLGFYLIIFDIKVFKSNKDLIFIFINIIIMLYVSHAIITSHYKYIYAIPFVLLIIILKTFFDFRLSLVCFILTLIILGILENNTNEFLLYQLVGGITSIISLKELRKRSQIFITTLFVFISYIILNIGISLSTSGIFDISFNKIAYFGVSSGILLLSYPIIYVYEKLFSYTTGIRLIELCDTNNKLLRELAIKASGTFQHSIQVSNICENIVRELGGNALLIRAGALYHDIGKLEMPMYYIENKTLGINPHDELTPEESARIIISHVVKGINLAKRNNLPDVIIDFIRTHHGTSYCTYFYNKYKIEHGDDNIKDDSIFRYRGPLPYSKETAILMIVDSVEAATRSLKEPNEENIRDLIEKIIDNIIKYNQLDNSDISFKDIYTIKKLLTNHMLSIYHSRISYNNY